MAFGDSETWNEMALGRSGPFLPTGTFVSNLESKLLRAQKSGTVFLLGVCVCGKKKKKDVF